MVLDGAPDPLGDFERAARVDPDQHGDVLVPAITGENVGIPHARPEHSGDLDQEPGTEAQIAEFCETTYGVAFPMFAKVDVNGVGAHPQYTWLKEQQRGSLGGSIKWNFTKFLVDGQVAVVDRYAPTTEPAKIAGAIAALLG